MLSKILKAYVLLVFFSCLPLQATEEKIESLIVGLSASTGSNRLVILAELTEYYASEAPNKAVIYGEEAIELFDEFPNEPLQLDVMHNLFDAYRESSQLDKASTLVKQHLALAEQSNNMAAIANAHVDFSNLLSEKDNDFTGALVHLDKACSAFKTLNDLLSLGSCLNNQGLAHYYNTDYELALPYYIEALKIDDYVATNSATHTLGNIALINMQYGRWSEALVYYHQALEHAKSFKKKSMISEQLINIGVAYSFNDELDKSIEYFTKASELQKDIGNINSLFTIAKRLGEVYVDKKQFNRAIEYYEQALTLSEQIESDGAYISIQMAIGVLNSKLENYSQALEYIQAAHDRAIKSKRKPYIYESYMNLYRIYKKTHQFDKALEFYEKYTTLKGEKIEEDRLQKISEFEEKFKAQQRESQIELLTKDKELETLKNQRLQYAGTLIILTVILLTIFIIYRQKQKSKIAHERSKLMEEVVEKKNQLLADVSHELATPLTVLKLQVESLKDDLEDDVHATYDALDNKLSDIDRLITDIHQLAQSDVGALNLNIEPFELNKSLDLWQDELTLFVNKNKLAFDIDRQLPEKLTVNFDRDRIKQIFINLLTNSIKYTDKPGQVKLSATTNNKALLLAIEDSAPTVPDNDLINIFDRLYRVENSRSRETGGSGLGLAICKSLIEEHNGKIYAEHSNLGGLKIIMELPIT